MQYYPEPNISILKNKGFEYLCLISVVISLGILLLPIPLLSAHRFILFSIFPVFYFSFLMFGQGEMKIGITSIDYYWVGLLILGFISIFWTQNKSVVWFPSFWFLGLLLWMIVSRSLASSNFIRKKLPLYFTLFFIIILCLHFIALFTGLSPHEKAWNSIFGYNGNYTSAILLSFLPFIIFNEKKHTVVLLLKILCTFLVFFFLIYTSARGAIIIFFFLAVFLLCLQGSPINFPFFVGTITFFSLIAFFYFRDYLMDLSFINDFGGFDDELRWIMIKNSFYLFQEDPLLGKGIGSWQLEAFKYANISSTDELTTQRIYQVGNHNIYSQYLAELGIVGFILFIYPLFFIIKKAILHFKKSDGFHKAMVISIFIYVLSSIIYRDANSYPGFFSGIQFFAFFQIGFLIRNFFSYSEKGGKALSVIFLVLSFLSLGWFIFSYAAYKKCYTANELYLLDQPAAVKLLESIYYPTFNTLDNIDQQPIALKLAELYKGQKEYKTAQEYYEKAVKQFPYNDHALLTYSIFLLRVKKDYSQAKHYAERVFSMQKDYWQVNYYLAEIAIEEKDFDLAREYLSNINYRPKAIQDMILNLEKKMNSEPGE